MPICLSVFTKLGGQDIIAESKRVEDAAQVWQRSVSARRASGDAPRALLAGEVDAETGLPKKKAGKGKGGVSLAMPVALDFEMAKRYLPAVPNSWLYKDSIECRYRAFYLSHGEIRNSASANWELYGHRQALVMVIKEAWEFHTKDTGQKCPITGW